jgi:hypothetical protein
MAVLCPIAGMERVVFYRERGALPYDAFAYGIAIALVDIPYLVAQVGAPANIHKFVVYVLLHWTVTPSLFTYIHTEIAPQRGTHKEPTRGSWGKSTNSRIKTRIISGARDKIIIHIGSRPTARRFTRQETT